MTSPMLIAYLLSDYLRKVLVPQARVYEVLAVEDGNVESYEPRRFVVLPEKERGRA